MSKVAAPATTFKFLPKDVSPPSIATENPEKHGFPPGKHWVDHVGTYQDSDPSGAGSIVVIEQPGNQYCAVTGGIMATRMKALGIKATVVDGRVRDLRELQSTKLPVCGDYLVVRKRVTDVCGSRSGRALPLLLVPMPRPRLVLVMCQSLLGGLRSLR